jgi:hypothetical protein
VCAVNFDKVDVCFEGAIGSFDERFDEALELVGG